MTVAAPPHAKPVLTTKVVGVSYAPGYPENLHHIANELVSTPGGVIHARLVREPENPYDTNAVAVFVHDRPVGHLPAANAERVAPRLDSGERWAAAVVEVPVHPDNPDQPGLKIVARPVTAAGDIPVPDSAASLVRLAVLHLGLSLDTVRVESSRRLRPLSPGERRSAADVARLWAYLCSKYAPATA